MVQPSLVPVREGDLLAGKYRVERVLGIGGMGVVVAARHEELGQLVAIKFVRDQALGNEQAVERFLREARAAVKLKSEHVARVLDVGKLDSGAPYMVMEYLEGSDLAQVLETDGPMPLVRAVTLVLQACEAVSEAHASGIVHRDLKPQNLFLTRTIGGSPKLKVLDFGVSKTTGLTNDGRGALTRTSAMLGSPLYMAPEQMRSSRDVDARVDIWALGVVLYELLTARWPFEAESMPELCLKVVAEAPQSLLTRRPDLPNGLISIVERCLEKEPAKRYASAADLARALEPFAAAPSSPGSRVSQAAHHASVETRALTTLPSQQPSPAASSTPAAWDSARPSKLGGPGTTSPRRPQTLAVRWAAAVIIAAALAGGIALAWRSLGRGAASSGPPSPSSATPIASALSSSPATATTPTVLAPSTGSGPANDAPAEIKPAAFPETDLAEMRRLHDRPPPAVSARAVSGATDLRSATTPANRDRLVDTPVASPKPTSARSRPAGKANAPDDDIPALR